MMLIRPPIHSTYAGLENTLQPLYGSLSKAMSVQYPTVQSQVTQPQYMNGSEQNVGGSFFPKTPISAPADIENIIQEASNEYGIDANLIKAVIKQESGFKPNIVSHAGAAGLMQLMPKTAIGLGISPEERFDPRKNIMAGTKYLSEQLRTFGSVPLALAAYNAGPTRVRKAGGIPNIKETQNYVSNIMNMWGYTK